MAPDYIKSLDTVPKKKTHGMCVSDELVGCVLIFLNFLIFFDFLNRGLTGGFAPSLSQHSFFLAEGAYWGASPPNPNPKSLCFFK